MQNQSTDPKQRLMARMTKLQHCLETTYAEIHQTGSRLIQRMIRTEAQLSVVLQQMKLLDAQEIFVHVMTDYTRHRIIRVKKGAKPAPHDIFSIRFNNDGRISLYVNSVEIPLSIEIPQCIRIQDTSYLVTPFFFRSDATRSIRENTAP